MTTYRRLALSAALGAVLAAAAIHAPAARADSSSFLTRTHAHGWYNDRGDAWLLDSGYQVCRQLDRGYTGTQIARNIYRTTDTSVTAADAVEFVILAVEELCPWFDHRGQGQAA